MNTIERYIFRRVLTASFGAFAAILAVVWVTQAMTRIDFATSSTESLKSYFLFITQLIPQFINQVLPFGIIFGSVQVLNLMNSDSEMAVLAGSGVGRWTIAKPVIAVGMLAAAYVLIAGHFIEPRFNRMSRDTLISARTDLLTTLLQPGRFTKAEKDLTLFVESKNADGQLQGIMVSDTREEDRHLTYYAREGAVGEHNGNMLLVMSNGQIHRVSPKSGDVSVISFQSYAITLGQFAAPTGKNTYFFYERETADLFNPDPDDSLAQRQPGAVRGEIYKRFSNWLYLPLYSLLALVFAGHPQSHRNAQYANLAMAFGTSLLYKWASNVIYSNNRVEDDYLILVFVLPIAGIIASAWMYFYGVQVKVPERVQLFGDRMLAYANILSPARRRLAKAN